MNRLQLLGKDATSSLSSCVQVEMARLSEVQRGVPHFLFAPLHYEPNYAYPLFVWLHGPGDDERQLQRLMPMVSMRNYVAIGPRGNSNYPGKRGKFRWCHTLDSLAAAEQNVFTAIDVAKSRYHISPHRVFLGGYQCGGTAALRIAMSYPQRFAGAITIGGSFPSELTPLAQLNSARKMPLLIAHGRDAQYYSVDSLCDDLRLCHSAGLSVSVRQYPTGDDLTTQMLHDINVWMMEIVTGIPAGPPHPPVAPVDAN